MVCEVMGCYTRVLWDGHRWCLHHALCMAEFCPFNPKACSPCTTVAALLQNQYLTAHELEYSIFHHHCANIVKLATKHRKAALWKDPDLPCMLGFVQANCLSPSPKL